MVVLIVALLLILVLAAVFSPWRWPETGAATRDDDRLSHVTTEVLDLEATRDAKYREIRDAELDRETGKLSTEDFIAIDAGLRAEAVRILQRLDAAQARLERLQRVEVTESQADALEQPERK